jgi:hypothetical protein
MVRPTDEQEARVAAYTSDVIETYDDDFPFMAIITDEQGTVVGEYLVRTLADGEAKVMEMLRELHDLELEAKAHGA